MTELEIMKRAKQYIDALANGTDPLSGRPVQSGDVVNQVRISRCLFYVSGVLQKVIDNGGEVQKKRIPRRQKALFSLTAEQASQLKPHTAAVSASRIVSVLNGLIDAEHTQKLKARELNDWLLSAGMLTEIQNADGVKRKIPTPDGERLGIRETAFTDEKGTARQFNVYDRQAQQFVFDNVDALSAFLQRTAEEEE